MSATNKKPKIQNPNLWQNNPIFPQSALKVGKLEEAVSSFLYNLDFFIKDIEPSNKILNASLMHTSDNKFLLTIDYKDTPHSIHLRLIQVKVNAQFDSRFHKNRVQIKITSQGKQIGEALSYNNTPRMELADWRKCRNLRKAELGLPLDD